MVISHLTEVKSDPIFFHLSNFLSHSDVYLKLEGLNLSGSIKLKTAISVVDGIEKDIRFDPDKSILVLSSSGNFALAMCIVCKERGYKLCCVSDPNISPYNEALIRLYGSELIKVQTPDENGGFLATRIRLIQKMCSENPNYFFADQYANPDNSRAHYETTAVEILNEFPNLDYLVIGAGTTGTLMGCAQKFKEESPKTKVIGVDIVGSVTFGGPSRKRYIPGLGTSLQPQLADRSRFDELIYVNEVDTIKMAHAVLKERGLLLGGSTASVLVGIKQAEPMVGVKKTVVGISPDFGEKYLDMIYNPAWVSDKFPQTKINEVNESEDIAMILP